VGKWEKWGKMRKMYGVGQSGATAFSCAKWSSKEMLFRVPNGCNIIYGAHVAAAAATTAA